MCPILFAEVPPTLRALVTGAGEASGPPNTPMPSVRGLIKKTSGMSQKDSISVLPGQLDMRLALHLLLISGALSFASVRCLSPTFLDCQQQKPSGYSQLEGCPDGTLFVSAADSNANFTSVQDAVLSLWVFVFPL